MMRHMETEGLEFGHEEEFFQRLNEFNHRYIEFFRLIIRIICRIPRNCWLFIKYLANSLKKIFLRKYIAVIVLFSSVVIFAAILALTDKKHWIMATYCLPPFASSLLSLFFKKGMVPNALEIYKLLEQQQQLLEQDICQNEQKANQPTGYAANGRRRSLQSDLENLKEPRPESEANPTDKKTFQVQADLYRSKSYNRFSYGDECSAGPSHVAEPLSSLNYGYGSSTGLFQAAGSVPDIFTITNLSDDYYDFDEPSRRRSVARISADAIKTFGHPVQVLGADSYRVVFDSSDENCSSDELVTTQVKTYADVYNSDSYLPLNLSNAGSSSAEGASVSNA